MTSQLGFQPSPATYPHSLPGVILQHQQLPPWQTSMVGYAFGNGCPPGIPPFPSPPPLSSWTPPVAPIPPPSDSAFGIHHPPHRTLPPLHGHNTAFQTLGAPPAAECDGFRAVSSSLTDHNRDAPQSSNSQASDKDTRADERTHLQGNTGFGPVPGSSSRQYDRDDYLRALLCTTSSHPDMRNNRSPAEAKAAAHYRRPASSTADADPPGPSAGSAATRSQLGNQETTGSSNSGPGVTPQQVKEMIGVKEFYMVRAKLIRQQQTLAEQILELNKLVRMQGILVSEVLHPEYENCRGYHEELRNVHKQDVEQQGELCSKLAEDLPLLLHLPSKIRGTSGTKLDIPARYKLKADSSAGLIKPTPRYKAKDAGLSSFDAIPPAPHISKFAAQLETLQSHSFQDVAADKDCNDSRISFPPAQQPNTPTMSGAGQTTKPSNAFDPHADWFARHFTNPKPVASGPADSQPVASETICKTSNTSPQPKAAQWWKDQAKIFGDIVLPSQLDSTVLQRESCWTRSSQDVLHPPLKKRSKFQEGLPANSDRQETSQSLPSLTKATVSKKTRRGKTTERSQGTSAQKSALKRVRYAKGDAQSNRDSARSEPDSGRSASSEGGFVCASQKSLKSLRQKPAPTQSITQESAAVHTLLSFTSSYKLV